MSREFTINASISFLSSELTDPIVAQIVNLIADISSGGKSTCDIISVAIAETAIPLGQVTSPGWFFAKNLDSTNFLHIRVGTAGSAFCKLKPGEVCLLRLGANVTAPYAIADTAACRLQYYLWDN
jgi:hypothetical protein